MCGAEESLVEVHEGSEGLVVMRGGEKRLVEAQEGGDGNMWC